eukprot:5621-Heterococcus_DN1.PRE.2
MISASVKQPLLLQAAVTLHVCKGMRFSSSLQLAVLGVTPSVSKRKAGRALLLLERYHYFAHLVLHSNAQHS